MSRMADRSETTQAQILEAVRAVIVREGVQGASLRTVAEEADVSLGLLSYHFDDKQTLIIAAFQRATDELLATSLDAVAAFEQPQERLAAYIRGAFVGEFLDLEYLTLRISLWALARTDPEIAEVEHHLATRYLGRLTQLLLAADATLTESEAERRATDIVATQNGLWLHWSRFADSAALERGLARCEAIAAG